MQSLYYALFAEVVLLVYHYGNALVVVYEGGRRAFARYQSRAYQVIIFKAIGLPVAYGVHIVELEVGKAVQT